MSEQILNVLPTKMQLMALKQRYVATQRGYQLLKKKLDAMTLSFRALKVKLVESRDDMKEFLKEAHWSVSLTQKAIVSSSDLMSSLANACGAEPRLQITKVIQNIAGVKLPSYNLTDASGQNIDDLISQDEAPGAGAGSGAGASAGASASDSSLRALLAGSRLPIALLTNQKQLETSKLQWIKALNAMVRLAGIQRSYLELDAAIQVTSRRVNAIEYFLLPRLSNTIHWISDVLEEGEREDASRNKKCGEIFERLEEERAEEEALQGRLVDESTDGAVEVAADPDILF